MDILADGEVVARVRGGEAGLFEVLMRRYNQRVYRAARAITGDDGEAADVVQDAFVRAYASLDQFAGRASFGTWVTQIAIHEAIARLRRRGRLVALDHDTMPTLVSTAPSPEQCAVDRELGTALEAAIDALPAVYRSVFILREVEGLSAAETAACLEIGEQTVKTRLHRARTVLRHQLAACARAILPAAFRFGGARCDAVVAAVLARIRNASNH
jgi:RNA polymerase sigma-70 factor, ECF subfamily